MKIIDCEQGSVEWHDVRCGIPTASDFGKIVTASKGEFSKQSVKYQYELLAEWITGHPKDGYQSDPMLAGYLRQPEAISFYEAMRDVDVGEIGFCLSDCGRYGCSPDGHHPSSNPSIQGGPKQTGVEAKCPKQHTHMATIVSGVVPRQHWPQIQGSLLVTEWEVWDFVSFHPAINGEIIPVERDEPYIASLQDALIEFCDRLDEAKEQLKKRGFEPAKVTA